MPATAFFNHESPRYGETLVTRKITCGLANMARRTIVRIDPRYFRPTEVDTLLGWMPEITAHQMCQQMAASDLQEAKCHALLKANGYRVPVSAE